MGTREELVGHLWREIIHPLANPSVIDNLLANGRRHPEGTFSGIVPAIEGALAKGVPVEDLCLIMRCATFEAVFSTLYAIGDPGVDGNDVFGLYEILSTSPDAKW